MKISEAVKRSAQFIVPMLLCSVVMFAQSSAFGQAAQGAAMETIAIAKWIGIIVCIVCGLGIAMNSEHHMFSKITGMFIGLIFALFASPIVNWVQSL